MFVVPHGDNGVVAHDGAGGLDGQDGQSEINNIVVGEQ